MYKYCPKFLLSGYNYGQAFCVLLIISHGAKYFINEFHRDFSFALLISEPIHFFLRHLEGKVLNSTYTAYIEAQKVPKIPYTLPYSNKNTIFRAGKTFLYVQKISDIFYHCVPNHHTLYLGMSTCQI